MVGMDEGSGGIGQSFLDTNRFSDDGFVFGHGVPALAGISSSGGGLAQISELKLK